MQIFRLPGVFLVAMVMIMAAAPVSAHHSSEMFDHKKSLTLKGAVTSFQWTNPHVHILVNGTVADGEQPADWVLELTSPSNLVRIGGWSQTALKAGDRVTIEFSPHRDPDKRLGLLRKLTVDSTGQVLTSSILSPEEPKP